MKMRHGWILGVVIAFLACHAPTEKRTVEQISQLISQNQLVEAKTAALKARAQYPDNLDFIYLYGWINMLSGDSSAALQTFGVCLAKDPNYYGGHKGMGALYFQQMKFDQAEKEYELALKARPDLPEIYGNLAEVKILKGDFKAAEALLEKARELRPKAADYYFLLARRAVRVGDLEKAQHFQSEAHKRKFINRPYAAQIDCLDGEIALMRIEQRQAAAPLSDQDRADLEAGNQALTRCEAADPQRFLGRSTQQRIRNLLSAKAK